MKWRDLSYSHATWEYLGADCGLKGAAQYIEAYDNLRRLMDPRKKEKREKKRGRKPKVAPEVRQAYCAVEDLLSSGKFFDIYLIYLAIVVL